MREQNIYNKKRQQVIKSYAFNQHMRPLVGLEPGLWLPFASKITTTLGEHGDLEMFTTPDFSAVMH